jgi:hypothetical protein
MDTYESEVIIYLIVTWWRGWKVLIRGGPGGI